MLVVKSFLSLPILGTKAVRLTASFRKPEPPGGLWEEAGVLQNGHCGRGAHHHADAGSPGCSAVCWLLAEVDVGVVISAAPELVQRPVNTESLRFCL